jgi:predicted nuclease with TOPRIM domain
MAEKYSAPPADVDFAGYKKSVRDTSLVENLETFYKAASPAPETYEWSAEDKAEKLKQIDEAKGRLAFTQEMIEETEAELAFMRENRTTRETSGTDIKEAYPDIAEETEKELEERKWFKDAIA